MAALWKILLFASTVTASTLYAAIPPDAGQLLIENTPPPSLIPEKEPPTFQKTETAKEHAPDGALVRITGFNFIGNTIFSNDELAQLMANCIGKEMTFAGLTDASTTITNAYRKKGYFLASLFFPPQTVTPGMPITIEIIEGILENIRVETNPINTRTGKSLLEGYARQVPGQQPVEEGSLTSMVMKTNELPNISSRILLEPGSRPGYTKATLEVTEGKPFSFSFDIDNYGNPPTGENRVGSTMELYSPLHLGDLFSLRLQTSTTGDLQNMLAGYTVPLTPYGTRIGVNYNYLTYRLGGLFKTLNAEGDAYNLTIALTQPLIRRRNLVMNATVAAEGRGLNDQIGSTSRNRRHTTSWQVGITGVQKDRILGGGSTSLSLGIIGGRLDINDSETLSIDQLSSGLHTNGSYSKLTLALARNQTISHGLALYAGAYGQWSNKNLTSSEQLSLGGPSAVRAWQRGESYGDRGMVATVELSYLISSIGELPGTVQFITFVDNGYALLHTNPAPDTDDNSRSLTGAGIGMKWFNAANYSLQATCAWKIAGESEPTDSPMIFVQAVKRF